MKKILLFMACMVGLIAGPVWADDFAPPPWRGAPLTVYAEWEFSNPLDPMPQAIYPDTFNAVGNPGGPETLWNGFNTHIDLDLPSNWTWNPADGDGGITVCNPDGASFGINMQNWVDQMPEKWIRIQITYLGAAPMIQGITGYPEDVPGGKLGHVDVDQTHFYEDWIILPNPGWEQIVVWAPCTTTIDEIVVDTISPEPTSLGLLAIAGLALLRRRG